MEEKVIEVEAGGGQMTRSIRANKADFDALKEVANGNSTKIFMPTDLTQIVSSLGIAGEALGIGDSLHAKKKPEPKPPIVNDACIDRHNSEISHGAAYAGAVIDNEIKRQDLSKKELPNGSL